MSCRESLTPAFWWCLAALLVVFASDLLLPLGLATAACYAVVVMVANRTTTTAAVNILTGTAVVFLGIGYLAWPDSPPPYWAAAGYRLSSAAALLMIARLSIQRRSLISRLEKANAKLAKEGEILNAILDNIADYVFLHDISGRYLYASRRAMEMSGMKSLDELKGKTWRELEFPEDVMRHFDADLLMAVSTGEPVTRELCAFFDGAWRDCEATLTRVEVCSSGPPLVVGTVRDISDRVAYLRQLRHQATHDALTDCPNRVLFVERLDHALARLKRGPEAKPLVVYLDVDSFKSVNDALGHQAGDEFLRKIAHRLSGAVRPGDTVARIGGDEFALLIESVEDYAQAQQACARIQAALSLPVVISGQELHPTASLGLVLAGPEYDDADKVIRDADVAMYRAKSRGGDQVVAFSEEMLGGVIRAAALEHDLKRAVRARQFEWSYQPILNLASGRIAGFEALIRWRHPEHGLVPPGEFIPLAEKSGIITAIDWLTLETACGKVAEYQRMHQDQHPFSLHVNLSPRHFLQPHLVENLLRLIEKTKFPPETLNLEITESILLEEPARAKAIMAELKEKGISTSIDDFGIGYSSLSYLKDLSFGSLKIDRSFTSQMLKSQENRAIVEAIVTMARILGLTVIVEGIETQAELDALKDMGCELGQGYLLGRPVPWDEAVARLGIKH